LRRPADFESVLHHARRMTSRNFAVWAQPNARGQSRLGIIAGKKAAARAVDRNRAKRLIRESFSAVFGEIVPVDVVVQLRTDLRALNNAAVRGELRQLLENFTRTRDATTG
jgi:ribonuclease P protein component